MIGMGLSWILDSVLLCVIAQAAATLRQFLGLRTLERLAIKPSGQRESHTRHHQRRPTQKAPSIGGDTETAQL
jgi:hypothetical protein